MKKKQFGKTLALKKKTIANLNNVEMTQVVGGFSQITCITYTLNCSFDEYTCKCGPSGEPVPTSVCGTIYTDIVQTCLCPEYPTQCTKCDC